MARKQTRRTISFQTAMLPAVAEAANRRGVSVAQYAHEAIAGRLRADGVEPPAYRPPSYAHLGRDAASAAAHPASVAAAEWFPRSDRPGRGRATPPARAVRSESRRAAAEELARRRSIPRVP